MATELEFALMAYKSYGQSDTNKVELATWTEIYSLSRSSSSGFAASVYTKGSEVVVAFRGTDDPQTVDYENGNIPAAIGSYSTQVAEAIQLVADTMALHPGATITFTGHSLGGGLASLMAAYFGLPAVTFDPAPFEASALGARVTNSNPPVIQYGALLQDYFNEYVAYQNANGRSGSISSAFQNYVTALSSSQASTRDAMYSQREVGVSGFYLQGESLIGYRAVLGTIAGSLTQIPTGETTLDGRGLHKIILLLSMMASPSLQAASAKLPSLIENLLDTTIYAKDDQSDNLNFLNRLLQDQVVDGVSTAGKALDRFAQDLLKLNDTGSTHLERTSPAPVDMEKVLITTLMEYYNFGTLSDTTPFVESVSNGIRFDVSRIPGSSDKKGQTLLLDSVKNLVTVGSGDKAREWADAADVWTIQAGSNGLTTVGRGENEVQIGSETQSNYLYGEGGNDLLITGSGNDELYGGAGEDVLLGGSGNDVLEGGDGADYINGAQGFDILKGGAGFDTYLFNANDGAGINRIIGDDNDGRIVIDGVYLGTSGAKELGSELSPVWQWSSGGKTFTYTLLDATSTTSGNRIEYSGGTLWVQQAGSADRIAVEQYATGDLSLDLHRTKKDDDAPGGPSDEGGGSGTSGTTAPTRSDPLVLDLDGDGVETTSPTSGPIILFDHNADGIRTGTGWVKPDDGWLVLDRDANGTIDSGRELFGVDTLKSNGQLATDGFNALRDLDGNADNKISALDDGFANLRIWRDLNQDGISQAAELTSLADNNIVSIGLGSTATFTNLGNGNIQTAQGTFTRSDGSSGTTGETIYQTANLDLLNNTFYRSFTTPIPLTEQALHLPDVHGSGRLRDLKEAASLSTDLSAWATDYVAQTTRQAQIERIDGLLERWANSSDMASLKQQAEALAAQGVTLTYNLQGLTPGSAAYSEFIRKLGVVERFMGFTYGGSTGQARTTPLTASAGNLNVTLAPEQIANITNAYNRFKTDIYESLLLTSRLKPLVDAFDASFVTTTPDFDGLESAVAASVASNPQLGAIDLIEFISAYGIQRLKELGWDAIGFMTTTLGALPDGNAFSEEITTWVVQMASAGQTVMYGTGRLDLLVGTIGNDTLFGGDGNDVLVGKAGDDWLYGGIGADTLDGGAGNDVLVGANWYGNVSDDTYLFGKGDGQDSTGYQPDSRAGKLNTLRFKAGVLPGDVVVTQGNSGTDLVLTIAGTMDSFTVAQFFAPDATSRYTNSAVQQVVFSDGTVWDVNAIIAKVLGGTSDNDVIYGLNDIASTISGGAGNDSLYGGMLADQLGGDDGNDSLDGGAGDDTLSGGAGTDVLAGGVGNNVYVFGRGNGSDTIAYSTDTAVGKLNAVQFGSDISPAEVIASRSGDDLVLSIAGTPDKLIVQRFFYGDDPTHNIYSPIQIVNFLDGTNWNVDALVNKVFAGTTSNDTITGTLFADTITGGAGDDSLWGSGGNDILIGGSGNDYIVGDNAAQESLSGNDYMDGGDGNDTFWGEGGADTIIGGDGNDVLNGDGNTVSFAMQGNDYLDGGAGNDTLYGYAGDDVLLGGSGNDTLYGGYGNDSLAGGNGDDVLNGESGNDVVDGGQGNDTFWASTGRDTYLFGRGDGKDTISYQSQFTETEAGILQLKEGIAIGDIVISQSSFKGLSLSINGTSDTFTVADVYELPTYNLRLPVKPLIDTVKFSDGTSWNLAYAMATNETSVSITNVMALGVIGNELDNTITGNQYSNSLVGGKGVDTLIGGAGDDVYVVDTVASWYGTTWFYNFPDSRLSNFLDTVVEGINQGNDTIYAYGVYSAVLPDNVENMIVDGASSATISFSLNQDVRRRFTGNALDNVIDTRLAGYVGVGSGYTFVSGGAGGEIVIDGGLGADTMIGSNLKTRYVVDSVGDVVVAGAGVTTIESYINYTLAPTYNHLTLVGTSAITGVGNTLNNTIDGSMNSAANILIGGAGDDVYVVGGGDVIQELSGEGVDTVKTTLSNYTLGADVENLTLTGQYSAALQNGTGNGLDNVIRGTSYIGISVYNYYGANTLRGDAGNDQLFGEGQNDTLYGGDGNDTLYGDSDAVAIAIQGDDYLDGGSGNDLMYGFAGNDVYAGFSGVTGLDIITDSAGANDRIQFSSAVDTNIEALQFSRVGNDLILATDANNSITVKSWYASSSNVIERLTIFNGGWDYNYVAAQIQGRADGVNTGPIVGSSFYGYGASTGVLFQYQIPYTAFYDIESQFSLNYTATLADGSPLPSWLVFNSATRSFEGTPPTESIGTLSILITAVDAGGLSASQTYNLTIAQGPIVGTDGDDTLNGTVDDNIIEGLAGNDVLNGLEGDDELLGDEGNDTLNGGLGSDYLEGSEGNDLLNGDGDNDELYGQEGDDALYGGAGDDILVGDFARMEDAGNDLLDGGTGADEMDGGFGNDIYIVDNIDDFVFEEEDAGVDEVRSSVTYTLQANFENLTLTGSSTRNGTGNELDNTLTGNSGNNILTGLAGNDTLDGGSAGTDSLRGGLGDDIYMVSRSSGVTITENAGEGIDTVKASVTYTLGNNLENLTLSGATAINGTGNTLANVIIGNGANNTLNGSAGADSLIGGAGNDTYVVDDVADVVTESASEGTDLVQSSVTYTLSANIENLTLTGSSEINGTGNTLANTLTGNSGNNVLDGGAGADTLVGGAGNDTYVVDNTGDVVTEATSAGTDLVQSSVTYTLATNVENLTLTGTTAINGTGNTLANIVTGNTANNLLDGGTGADTLIGGLGNDTYVIDNTGDVVTENANEGADLVQSSVTYTLAVNVENLTLTGTAANGTGNTLDNILTGNSANNTLTGGAGNDTMDGGTGTDTMVGGTGNDIYYVDATTDVTTEAANEGVDVVNSSVTLTLAANIELLFQSGSTAINGTGNALANLLRGNTANNTLAGGGGTDILEGGAGNDILSNTSGNTFLNGGAGTDTLTGTANNDLLIGGTGNDAITTGQGADLIAFNKGDGQDTVAVSTTKDNTLSIGGGTNYADLLFHKSGNSLILKVGSADQITFTNYYASTSNRSVNKLQVVLEGSTDYNAGSSNAMYNKKVETFDFGGLVSAFDAALTANPSLTSWSLSNALLSNYVTGSDTAALGGDLAYQYGRFGNEGNVSYTPAIGVLGSASFGTAAQTLQGLAVLQDASPRLS